MSGEKTPGNSFLWCCKKCLAVFILLALGLTVGFPQLGVIGAFVIAIVVPLIARRHGSFRDMGFRRPESWPGLIVTTLAYGVVIQLVFTVVIEPLLSRLTGAPVDIGVFDDERGDFSGFLVLLAIGWLVGGLLEEMTFRGFIVGRLSWMLGSGKAATWFAVFIAAAAFGIAHSYQGVTGMIATGMIGFIQGAVYVCHGFNLWYAIFTHGFINTVAIVAIYLDADRELSGWLFQLPT